MTKKKIAWNAVTKENIIERCEELGFQYINHYSGERLNKKTTMVEFICSRHKEKGIQTKSWYDMQRYSKVCPYCTGRYKTTEDFRLEMSVIHPTIAIVGEYRGSEININCHCTVCGHDWSPVARSLRRSGCPKCANKRRGLSHKKSHEQFTDELRRIQPHLEICQEYTKAHQMTRFHCTIHDCYFDSIPVNLLNHTSHCPECTKDKQRERVQSVHDYFIERVNSKRSDLNILGTYNGYHSEIVCECIKHKQRYTTNPGVILDGHVTCPLCRDEQAICSYGESGILRFLNRHQIEFKDQHKFEYCKHIMPLRFDFYLPEYNTCIEYDGEQHYKPVTFNNISMERAIENLEDCKIKDQIKNEYCSSNNITLIRIPYWERDNIESILLDKLNLDPQRLSSPA